MKAVLAAIGLSCLLGVGAVQAQAPAWPQKQVTIVVPFGAGGTTDLFARIVAEQLQAKYGKPFVIENRPGAGGNIGTTAVAKAAPDGHTLLVGTVSTHAINPFLYKNLPHDTEKDFVAITGLAKLPNLLVVTPKVPVKTFAEFVEYAKQNPGKLNYGSSGAGTSQHLAAELFQLKTGAKMTHVPFRSSQDIVNGLIGGHIDLAFDNMTIAWPQAQAGTVRALAVTSPERSAQAPEIPAIAESLTGFDATSWNGLWAPAGTPQAVVDTIAADVKAILEKPEVQKKAAELASTPAPMTPKQFAEYIQGERQKWSEVVKAVGIQLGQ
ncbi:Bug family tripartite tricarboxylate transporter substrate binding protein [Microvirga zambiensis]|uniref:Bug family tripartite tricarboxylate transporter substrate binding protein n=1 Tax=Microvirga zambiensis TaxID=1402137 RepID=UPI00191DB776|nr:tripartite tricarboxylate transporter substrate binding protein [Microvirga zambiensis]